jgi:hypothetical protein
VLSPLLFNENVLDTYPVVKSSIITVPLGGPPVTVTSKALDGPDDTVVGTPVIVGTLETTIFVDASTLPDIDPVLTEKVNVSLLSPVESRANVVVTVAALLLTVVEPESVLGEKSADVIPVPAIVQYIVVPLGIPFVEMLKVTLPPSEILEFVGVTEYAGISQGP